MKLSTNGIVINEYGQVLMIQRDDTRTLAPPGGGIEAGELPTDNTAREIREETGLIAMPVRLTGLYFWPFTADMPMLNFTFRCIQRGGQMQTSAESLRVGFFGVNPLPRSLINIHRERVLQAWQHQGGPPIWKRQKLSLWGRLGKRLITGLVYPWKNWQRRRRGEPAFVPAPPWRVAAYVVMRNEQDQVVWVRQPDGQWSLPGGPCGKNEAPWETAVAQTQQQTGLTLQLEDLAGVYVTENEADMALLFTAVTATVNQPQTATETAVFTPGQEPEASIPHHRQRVADAVGPHTETIFRHEKEAGST
jgi:ADP-ribose pyrophosphatase YjhB (NUDIX family)